MRLSKPFDTPLRPDKPPKRHRPFTAPGNVVDAKLKVLTLFLAVNVVWSGFNVPITWYGMSREAAPPAVVAPVFDPAGNLVNAAWTDTDADAKDAVVTATLRELIWRERRILSDMPEMSRMRALNDQFYRGNAEARRNAHFSAVGDYKEAITNGFKRMVVGRVRAWRRLETTNIHRMEWVEESYHGNGAPIPGSRREQWMEAIVATDKTVPADKRQGNPHAIYLEDFSWSVSD
jgi:type IV secretory pathway TrbF-like protein